MMLLKSGKYFDRLLEVDGPGAFGKKMDHFGFQVVNIGKEICLFEKKSVNLFVLDLFGPFVLEIM